MIKLEYFRKIFPHAPIQVLDTMNKIIFLEEYSINSIYRVSAFMANCAVESGYFTRFVENLNYSPSRLIEVFPNKFDRDNVGYYTTPELIGNKVYANKNGNRDEASGDGYLFRGRGLIHITGRVEYENFAKYKGISLDKAVSYCETIQGAVESSAWYWKDKKLNEVADASDFRRLTKRINNQLVDYGIRVDIYNGLRDIFNNKPYNGKVYGSSMKGTVDANGDIVQEKRVSASSEKNMQYARDSDYSKGSRVRIRKTRILSVFYREEFACKCGCGMNTIDVKLAVILKKLYRSINKKIIIEKGIVCSKSSVDCNDKIAHQYGRAADIRVEGMTTSSLVSLIKGIDNTVNCYAFGNLVHLDTFHEPDGSRVKISNNYYRDQFACHCGCGFDTVDVNLAVILEKITEKVTRKLNINCACRCATENRRVGGAKASSHMLAKAADIKDLGSKDVEALNQDKLTMLIDSLFGDLIFYYKIVNSTHAVHIDSDNI